MIPLLGPPWIEASIGMAGVAWALFAIGRAQRSGLRSRYDATSAWCLLIFGALVVMFGLSRWTGVLEA